MGSILFRVGEFGMPYWVVGSMSFIIATSLYILIPPVETANRSRSSEKHEQHIRLMDIFMVSQVV